LKEAMTNPPAQPRSVEWLGYGACALAGTLWGTGFFFGRIVLDEMSVEPMVLYRFLFASLIALPLALRHRVRLTPSEARTLFVAAAFGIPIQFLLQFHGLALTTVSHASLMVGAMPVLLAASATLFAGESLDWIGWLALFGSTLGAALVVLGGSRTSAGRDTPSLAGDLLVILSLITALAWVLLSKKLMQTHSPPVVSAYTILLGTVTCRAAHAPIREPVPRRTHQPQGLGRARHQRRALHGHHHAALELGHSPCSRLARRRLFEHRTGTRPHPRRGDPRRASGPLRVAGRRAHHRRSRGAHNPRPRT
jgi:hypothetical protein